MPSRCKKPKLSVASSYCKYKCRCKRCKKYAISRQEYIRKWRWFKRYGLTESQYKALGSKCHICGTTKSGMKRAKYLLVDHDHKTGKIRGLLCNKCNLGISNFNDSILLMSSAIAYLYKNKDEGYVRTSTETFERSN